MLYDDLIYGKEEILEPVILKIIESPSFQRLKDVDQSGYAEPYFPGSAHSRFEHSVGVFNLLKKYHASLEEQIAGLIHDLSHSAFSHCIDYALDGGSETHHNYQDNIFSNYVKKSEVAEILKNHDFDVEYILDDANFPLKETDLPDLCADRIDYSLRTALHTKEITQEKAAFFLNNLEAEGGKWIFKNFESAYEYAKLFLKISQTYYASFSSAIMFRTVGDFLKYALQKNYISKEDLYTTDKKVLAKTKPFLNTDTHFHLLFKRMNGETKITNDPQNFDAEVFCKSRVINPLCRHKNSIQRISDIEKNWLQTLQQESQPKKYYLKF